jgi:hypothetical protein
MNADYKKIMHIQMRVNLTVASLAFGPASWLRNEVSASDLKEAKVTQIIEEVRLLQSNASPRPAVVNDSVRHVRKSRWGSLRQESRDNEASQPQMKGRL